MVDDDLSRLHIDREKYQPRARKKKKRYVPLFAALAIIIIGGILYASGILIHAVRAHVTNVATMYPSQTFTLLNASGYVVAQRKSAVSAKTTSWLVSLSVEEGSKVKAGDIIARLENEDVRASLEKSKANIAFAEFALKEAEAELTDATLAYNRSKELIKQGIIAQSEFDTAEARYKRSKAAVETRKAALLANKATKKEIEVSLGYTFIRAPFDAVVLTKNADIGDIVTPIGASTDTRASIVTIADMDSLLIEADVSESNIGQVFTGQPCEIQLDALPNERFRGKVHMIVPTADRSKASVMVKVAFIDKDPRILPEMSAKVAFLTRPVEKTELNPVTMVPVSAVISKGEQSIIYTVDNNYAVEKQVTTGRRFDDMVEIVSGIEAGSRIVTAPQGRISDGTRITVREE